MPEECLPAYVVERSYTIIDSVEETTSEIVFRIFPPEPAERGYSCRVTVAEGEDVREFKLASDGDAWLALDSAFRFARTLIVRMHDLHKGQTILLNDERVAGWL